MKDIKMEDPPIDSENLATSIIKVIGVGGGGSNAVNHMYRKKIKDVAFAVCNTNNQDLLTSPVPYKLQLGPKTTKSLGAGAFPEIGQAAAEESYEDIKKMLADDTQMVFITAGMGGGTGTGASPVIARAAKEVGILTIAIVTTPFKWEMQSKVYTALEGVRTLIEYVDAILLINNEKLRTLPRDTPIKEAFAYADDVLANAAKSIAEIITVPGYIGLDFADVKRILENGQVAVMNTGEAQGEQRIEDAINKALDSALINCDITTSKKILLNFYCSEDENQISVGEFEQIDRFVEKMMATTDVVWGVTFDNTLGKNVKVTLIATGFDIETIPGMKELLKKLPKTSETQETQETQEIQQPISVDIDSDSDQLPHQSQQEQEMESQPPQPSAEQSQKELIEKAMEEMYGISSVPDNNTTTKNNTSDDTKPKGDVFDIDDFEDESVIKTTENTPAFVRGW
ncbi:MAG: cell division protein FtsZ [Paludibacter sp.]|nr:cell division protein FtsZ [Paludibacter sp.]